MDTNCLQFERRVNLVYWKNGFHVFRVVLHFIFFSLVSVLLMVFQTVIWKTTGISIPFCATCSGPQGDIGC